MNGRSATDQAIVAVIPVKLGRVWRNTECTMKRKTVAIALGLLAVAGAGVGLAVAERRGEGRHGWHGQGPLGGMRHGAWGGGRTLTKDDFDTRTRERFARLDKNSDGALDQAEIEAGMTQRMGQRGAMFERFAKARMARVDENRDGKVTKEEFLGRIRRMFAEMDLNNDGKISDDDLPPMMRGRGALAGGQDGGAMMGPRGRGGMLAGRLRGADANKDGVITLDEALAAGEKQFTAHDRNRDGNLDKADGDQMRKEMTDYRVKRFIHHYGADKDGKVTREQFNKKAAERFAMMDLDNDGKVTRDEMPGRSMRGRGPGRGQHGMGGDGDMSGPGSGERGGWRRGGPRGGVGEEPQGGPRRP